MIRRLMEKHGIYSLFEAVHLILWPIFQNPTQQRLLYALTYTGIYIITGGYLLLNQSLASWLSLFFVGFCREKQNERKKEEESKRNGRRGCLQENGAWSCMNIYTICHVTGRLSYNWYFSLGEITEKPPVFFFGSDSQLTCIAIFAFSLWVNESLIAQVQISSFCVLLTHVVYFLGSKKWI